MEATSTGHPHSVGVPAGADNPSTDEDYALGMLHHLMAEMRTERDACKSVPTVPKATAERMEEIFEEIDRWLTPVERVRMEWRTENGADPYDMSLPVEPPVPAGHGDACPGFCNDCRPAEDGATVHRRLIGGHLISTGWQKPTDLCTVAVEQVRSPGRVDTPIIRLGSEQFTPTEWAALAPLMHMAAAVAEAACGDDALLRVGSEHESVCRTSLPA